MGLGFNILPWGRPWENWWGKAKGLNGLKGLKGLKGRKGRKFLLGFLCHLQRGKGCLRCLRAAWDERNGNGLSMAAEC